MDQGAAVDGTQAPDLDAAILAVLRGRSRLRRLQDRLLGAGMTVREVFEGLPRGQLGEGPGLRAEQEALGRVRASLERLRVQGLVERTQSTGRTFLNTKGSRLILVDRYRARGPG